MTTTRHQLDVGPKGFARGLAIDLANVMRDAHDGDLLVLESTHPALDAALLSWTTFLGHALIEKSPRPGGGVQYLIRLGDAPDYSEDVEDPAHRLWLYANFNCNLACDYCCVRSSPRAEAKALPLETIRRLAGEAKELGFRRIFLTGGEPFLRPDLDEVVQACTEELPTTLLTNAMLWDGPRGALLERMPRDRLTLQVSLDSPEPGPHDAHRGAGSWQKARGGIARARALGFRVRIAATTHTAAQAEAMKAFLEKERIPPSDRIVRPVALRGAATAGVPLLRAELRPEVTVTGDGIFWHPVGATDEDFRVLRSIGRLRDAVAAVREMERGDRASSNRAATVFHCA